MAKRCAIHAYVSEQSMRAWQTFSDQTGVSVSGLLEAKGLALADAISEANGEAGGIESAWVKEGRRIDAIRRRRGNALDG